jgi:hypothetical protein
MGGGGQQGTPKRWYLTKTLLVVKTQKTTSIWIFSAVKISNFESAVCSNVAELDIVFVVLCNKDAECT